MSERWDYKLVTFYNRGSSIKPFWEVYGHFHLGNNIHLGTLQTKTSAMEFAHEAAVGLCPVMQGTNYAPILKALQEKSDE